jgi:hypothetical protein
MKIENGILNMNGHFVILSHVVGWEYTTRDIGIVHEFNLFLSLITIYGHQINIFLNRCKYEPNGTVTGDKHSHVDELLTEYFETIQK